MRVGFLSLVLLTSCLTRAYGQGIERDAFSAQSVVNQYRTSCHNDRLKKGELSFAALDIDRPDPNNPMWEKAIRKVRTGMMPPAGAKRPDQAHWRSFTTALEASLDRASAAPPNPGTPALHRLNRTEYANVRARHSGARHRCHQAVAPGRHDARVRQHRRCAHDFAHAVGQLHQDRCDHQSIGCW